MRLYAEMNSGYLSNIKNFKYLDNFISDYDRIIKIL